MQLGFTDSKAIKPVHVIVVVFSALVAVIALTKSIRAEPSRVETCDEMFEQRGAELQKAADALVCYETALTTAQESAEIRRLQEGAFHSVIWLHERLTSNELKLKFLNSGLALAAKALRDTPKNAIGYYWDAVITSLACQIKDKGKVIPTCIMGAKKEIMNALETTRSLEPSLEGYGGSRILGIMLTKMPGIVGGNKKRGEELLTQALSKSPNYSTNFVELGQFLLDRKRDREATKILNTFLGLNCLTMNPNRALECEVDQATARRLLGR